MIYLTLVRNIDGAGFIQYFNVLGYSKPVSHQDLRNLTKAEWEERLTPEQFSVCREQCTEPVSSTLHETQLHTRIITPISEEF